MATTPQAHRLARRLRDLRESHWSHRSLTQLELARAMSAETRVAPATLSSWESATNPKPAPDARLRVYALFFCTDRSIEGEPHLVQEVDLDDDERATFRRLEAELIGLAEDARAPGAAEQAPAVYSYTWDFTEGPITAVCPEVPEADRPALASERDPNYTRLYRYADVDALAEWYGHVRASNPELDVYHRLPSELVADDVSGHLVLIGGVGWNSVTKRLLKKLSELPVSQVDAEDLATGEIFRVSESAKTRDFYPTWEDGDDGHRDLIEDVGFLARVSNPFNSKRTLTICNGIHSRGVLGAVRCLTDKRVRDTNEAYLADRFPEGTLGLLIRVSVIQGEAITPDLSLAETRLYEWPGRPAERGVS